MKTFVRVELEADNNFHYPSGKVTSRMNLGQIVKIAIELRTITQKAIDDQDSEADEGSDENEESIERRSQMQSWFHFCESKVAALEKTWNRKLEKSEADETQNANSTKPEAEDDHEQRIENIFMNFKPPRERRRANTEQPSKSDEELKNDIAVAMTAP